MLSQSTSSNTILIFIQSNPRLSTLFDLVVFDFLLLETMVRQLCELMLRCSSTLILGCYEIALEKIMCQIMDW